MAGLTEEEVQNQDEMKNSLIRGSLSRTTGSTLMNTESSRSHAIFSLILEKLSKDGLIFFFKILNKKLES